MWKIINGKFPECGFSLKNVPDYLIPEFIGKIIEELNDGKTNVFELAHIVKELRNNGDIRRKELELVLKSKKIQSNPSVIKQILNDEELNKFEDIDKYFNTVRDQKIESEIWSSEILDKIYN